MQDTLQDIYQYAELHSSFEDEALLHTIERNTHLRTLAPRMISGRMQGAVLQFLSKMKSPDTILEIGTFTGYASICMAGGLKSGGKLYTIEYNPEHACLAKEHFDSSNYRDIIELLVGDAKTIIPGLNQNFDIVLIDADKVHNETYYELVLPKCNSGALILIDNILWSGKVLNPSQDKKTQIIHDFNQKVKADPRVNNLLLPIRDGLNVLVVL